MIQKKTNYHNKKNEIVNNKNKSKMDNILEKLIPKIKDNRYSTAEFLKLYEKKNEELNKNELEGKNKRKNNPYKGIITDFDYNKKINDNKDLIVFKPQDENKEDIEKDFKNHNSIIEQQDIDNQLDDEAYDMRDITEDYTDGNDYNNLESTGYGDELVDWDDA